jgi:hypothetical protein
MKRALFQMAFGIALALAYVYALGVQQVADDATVMQREADRQAQIETATRWRELDATGRYMTNYEGISNGH